MMCNRKTEIKLFLFLTLFLGLSVSCVKNEDFPAVPEIEFKEFQLFLNEQNGITERGVLIFDYQDGDGDIGLDQGDTLSPYLPGTEFYYNLIIRYFELQNGQWKEVELVAYDPSDDEFDTLTFNARIPVLTPIAGNKSIKGTIQDTLFVYNPLSDFDTIKFTAYIYDRALNKSNEIETPPILLVK